MKCPPRPDWHTLNTYQTQSAAVPMRHVAQARTLRAMVPGAKKSDVYHACTEIVISDGMPGYGPITEYRHELQISPALDAYLKKAPSARLKVGVRYM